jgi:hypothetical protein
MKKTGFYVTEMKPYPSAFNLRCAAKQTGWLWGWLCCITIREQHLGTLWFYNALKGRSFENAPKLKYKITAVPTSKYRPMEACRVRGGNINLIRLLTSKLHWQLNKSCHSLRFTAISVCLSVLLLPFIFSEDIRNLIHILLKINFFRYTLVL